MVLWLTEIIAIDPQTDEIRKWAGPKVPGIDQDDAQKFCYENGLGFCKVVGKFIESVSNHEQESYFDVQYLN